MMQKIRGDLTRPNFTNKLNSSVFQLEIMAAFPATANFHNSKNKRIESALQLCLMRSDPHPGILESNSKLERCTLGYVLHIKNKLKLKTDLQHEPEDAHLIASMRLDLPAPLGPITAVKSLKGPIICFPA